MSTDPPSAMPSTLLPRIFTSLSRSPRPWSLTRILKSANASEINGELRGTATFRPLRADAPSSPSSPSDGSDSTKTKTKTNDILYREEGEMPTTLGLGAGLRFSKKYIWRMSETGRVSVWFAKVQPQNQAQDGVEEPDYLFHDFEVTPSSGGADSSDPLLVSAPVPPSLTSGSGSSAGATSVVMARGNHLCINDMYYTAYAFRVCPNSGEVVSWSSRHVVKGPKKDQDIVNLYTREG